MHTAGREKCLRSAWAEAAAKPVGLLEVPPNMTVGGALYGTQSEGWARGASGTPARDACGRARRR